MQFDGKIALVTGSSGIGLASAQRLAAEGATVHLCGNDGAVNEKARRVCFGTSITVHEVDVSKESEVENWIEEVAAEADGIDVLVNSAGIQTYGDLSNTSIEDWDRVMSVNLRGCFLTSHFAYPHMLRIGAGSIIHISSVQGHANQYGVLGYATSKGALHALTRAMAVDCAKDGVRVNSISPGSIRTPLLEFGASNLATNNQTQEEMLVEFGKAHPIGRIGTAEEVAELVAYLASDAAGFCTGADFKIDGGLTAFLGV